MNEAEKWRAIVDETVHSFLESEGAVGLAVGVCIGADEDYFFGYGETQKGSGKVPTSETPFEIGSITKLFTANLLADMSLRGELSVDDPISKHLPAFVKPPTFRGEEIRLKDLSQHTSSLPRLPANLDATVKDESDPYLHYDAQSLYEALNTTKLRRAIGSRVEYSNFGVGLLGHLLSLVARRPLGDMYRERICAPLGLETTSLEDAPDLAYGHNVKGEPTPPWHFDSLAGAGGLRSTADDTLTYIRANLSGSIPWLERCLQPDIPKQTGSRIWEYLVPLGITCLSLGLQMLIPVPPGSVWFLILLLAPVLIPAFRALGPFVLTAIATLAGTWWLWREDFGFAQAAIGMLGIGAITHGIRASRPPRDGLALGWQLHRLAPDNALAHWHNGGTGGFCSFLGIVKESQVGVYVVANSSISVDDIGFKLLERLHKEQRVWAKKKRTAQRIRRALTISDGEGSDISI